MDSDSASVHNRSAGSRGSARTTATAVLVVVSLVSILIGMGIDRLWYAQTLVHTGSAPHSITFSLRPPTSEQREARRDQIATELHLSDAQRQQLDSIMSGGAVRFDALRNAVRPQVQHLVDDMRQQIERILTPEQRELFIKMRTTQRSRT